VQILHNIVPNSCRVKPIGSKHGFHQRILGARNVQQNNFTIAGIKDRDFDNDDSVPTDNPHNWYATDNNKKVQIGWYWDRKEIENYLIDPKVVKRSLGSKAPPLDEYKAALQASAKKIANYTAARIALSCVYYLNPPFNCWGEEREPGHFFPKDKGLKEQDCRSKISSIFNEYQQKLVVSKAEVLAQFEQLRQDCRPGGCRFQQFLTFFAGKDLLYGMRHDLQKFGFKFPGRQSCYVFRDSILDGIQKSGEDIWEWLPEWQRLRELILSFSV
jgi:hypothetical protein